MVSMLSVMATKATSDIKIGGKVLYIFRFFIDFVEKDMKAETIYLGTRLHLVSISYRKNAQNYSI